MSNYVISDDMMASANELYHYGVLGMKWGHRKAQYRSSRNAKLEKKAYAYDKKSAVLMKKAEKAHATNDLGRSNKSAIKSAKYSKSAANLHKKALSTGDDSKRLRLEKKAAKLEYKSAKQRTKADRLSKSVGYGAEAMKYSIKSDKAAVKAAKARAKIANNKAYVNMMNRKMSSLSPEKRRKVEQSLMESLRPEK